MERFKRIRSDSEFNACCTLIFAQYPSSLCSTQMTSPSRSMSPISILAAAPRTTSNGTTTVSSTPDMLTTRAAAGSGAVDDKRVKTASAEFVTQRLSAPPNDFLGSGAKIMERVDAVFTQTLTGGASTRPAGSASCKAPSVRMGWSATVFTRTLKLRAG